MKKGIKNCLGFGLLCLFILICFSGLGMAKDPDYPTKPIEFVIGQTPGSTTDIASRALCDAVSKHLPQPFMPINKPGGGGAIAATIIKESKPDGYRVGILSRSPAFVTPFTQQVSYDPLRDFTPISYWGDDLDLVMVRGDSPWKTWKELVEWAKKHPGELKVGIPGPKLNQSSGIVLGRIELREKVKFIYVPFKGSLEVLTALLGGNIDLYVSTMDAATEDYLKMGKVRLLSYMGKNKLPGYENIPTTDEMYGITICNMIGVVGPKGLPPYVVKRLEEAFAKGVNDPAFVSVMKKMYTPIVHMNGQEMGRYMEQTYKEQKEAIELLMKEEGKK